MSISKLRHGHLFTCLFLLFSVSTSSLAQPLEVAASDVQSCKYIDEIEVSSGYGKKTDWQSLAKYSALTRAENLGASHVVWERFISIGAFNGIAIAKSYNCES